MEEQAHIEVSKLNEAFVTLKCASPIIEVEISNFFSIYAENYRFTPAYKMGNWDGKIRFFKQSNNALPIGLLYRLKDFATNGNYKVVYNLDKEKPLDYEVFKSFVDTLGLTYPPRDYQLQAAYDAVRYKKISIESVTSSGKSMIIYLIARWMESRNKRTILIVPTTSLVEQMAGDFQEYGWNITDKVHKIYSGQSKFYKKPVIISTWQSIYEERTIFGEFDCLIIDEAHGAKAKSLQKISSNCINCEYRIGLSGTFPDYGTADYYTICGALGPLKTYTTDKQLEERGIVAKLKIVQVMLDYPFELRRLIFEKMANSESGSSKFASELNEVISLEGRNKLIRNIVKNLDKNVMILFNRVRHGETLRDMIAQDCPDRRVYYVDGDVKTIDREKIRRISEEQDNVVVVASYQTFSTGISIKNLHYMIFATGYKSKIKVLQSLGRIRRKVKGVNDLEQVTCYDLIDRFEITKKDKYPNEETPLKWMNYGLRHFFDRSEYYKEREFNVKTISYDIKVEV